MNKKVVVYSQPGRIFCDKVKEFLSQQHVAYVEQNIAADERALADLVALSFRTTPVTLIDGEAVIGFNAARFSELLGL